MNRRNITHDYQDKVEDCWFIALHTDSIYLCKFKFQLSKRMFFSQLYGLFHLNFIYSFTFSTFYYLETYTKSKNKKKLQEN